MLEGIKRPTQNYPPVTTSHCRIASGRVALTKAATGSVASSSSWPSFGVVLRFGHSARGTPPCFRGNVPLGPRVTPISCACWLGPPPFITASFRPALYCLAQLSRLGFCHRGMLLWIAFLSGSTTVFFTFMKLSRRCKAGDRSTPAESHFQSSGLHPSPPVGTLCSCQRAFAQGTPYLVISSFWAPNYISRSGLIFLPAGKLS